MIQICLYTKICSIVWAIEYYTTKHCEYLNCTTHNNDRWLLKMVIVAFLKVAVCQIIAILLYWCKMFWSSLIHNIQKYGKFFIVHFAMYSCFEWEVKYTFLILGNPKTTTTEATTSTATACKKLKQQF